MSNEEIEVVSDAHGVAVLGERDAVDKFLSSKDLTSKVMPLERLKPATSTGAAALQAGAELSANYGRWVKLSAESSKVFKTTDLMKGSSSDLARAVVMKDGKISSLLEIVTKPTAVLSNPALLAGVGGIMAQYAMQQTMDEITDYLKVIDEKVDDVLRAQNDTVLADLDGVGMLIDDAMVVWEQVGHVGDTTWSKIDSNAKTIATTQSYALRALDALAEKLEKKSKMGELAKTSREVESKVNQWLVVLVRCFQLQDGMSVLELDHVLNAAPEVLEKHRAGLAISRQRRLAQITDTTEKLLERISAVAQVANSKVLLHPRSSGDVVRATNAVSSVVVEFQSRLGIDSAYGVLESKKWTKAVAEVRDKVSDAGSDGLKNIKQFGDDTKNRALDKAEGVAASIAENIRKSRETDSHDAPDAIEK
ncbi:hypothetical protein [Glutamicibacter arilaitensis]|uniref:Uncharacterized protein n=1 Tax=Glutamicibacter arilaitensis TaxID=256701 RepID=A0A2N7S4Y0_9MICC|nr:hypothetical protein [Glutamicibacter arilaitensis]PMQ21206.1 hypothetical protein CIK84_06470 [Glutamicibacter arilaitensis]